MKASIRELKDHLSEYIHYVQDGREITVMSHSRAVAKIIPLHVTEITKTAKTNQLIQDLETLHERLKHEMKGKPMLEIVLDERRLNRF